MSRPLIHPERLLGVLATSVLVSLAIATAGCEDETLSPASGFKPSECLDPALCETGGKIDAGLADLGLPPINGGTDTGIVVEGDAGGDPIDTGAGDPPDGGVAIDSGDSDTGVAIDVGNPEFLNLAGTHDTEYLFDWSAYLFGIGTIAGPLDVIAQTISGNVNTGFPPLDALIRAVVAQFVPPWLRTVVNVLNSVANFFEEVEVTGVMNIAQGLPLGNISPLNASETWNTMTVRLISQCPMGRMDPNYPTCARQQINIVPLGRTGVGPLDVEVAVANFQGTLQAGRPEADFMFDDRGVDIDLYKLVTIVIDLAINLGTNGQVPSLSAALNQIIDCVALEARAYQIATNFGLSNGAATLAAAAVRRTCDREKQNIIDGILNGLNGIGLSIVHFDYDQFGHAVDTNGNHRPETLQVMTTPDTIDGRFRLVISDPLGGVWRGTNRSP